MSRQLGQFLNASINLVLSLIITVAVGLMLGSVTWQAVVLGTLVGFLVGYVFADLVPVMAIGDGAAARLRTTGVAAFVVSLTGKPSDASLVAPGKQIFADNCAACHGDDAKGKRDVGAPNLADAIWLKGQGEDAIVRQVTNPKHGMMPAWSARLGDTTVKELAVYIHSLGGGE